MVQFTTDKAVRTSTEFPGMGRRPLSIADLARYVSVAGGSVGEVTTFVGPEGESCRMTLTWE